MTDIKPSKDEDEVEPTPNLEEVHAKALHDIESEPEEVAPEEAEADEDVDDPKVEPAKEEDEEPVPDPPKEEPEAVEPPEVPTEQAVVVPSVPEEIPKVTIKDADGETHEFATADDIPDEFEPFSYKEFAVGTSKLAQREVAVREAQEAADAEAAAKSRDATIAKTRAKWEADIAKLTADGSLDKDETVRQETIDNVYKVMQEAVNEGNPISSFAQAYELHQFRQSKNPNTDTRKQVKDEQKRRGSRIMSGGSGGVEKKPGGAKVFQAPPSGVSLDQVHESTLGNL